MIAAPRRTTGGLGADHILLVAGGTSNGPVEAAATARPRPARQWSTSARSARPSLERLLREGARRPLLPLLRARTLRRPLRARGDRLPGRLRALDRTAEPRLFHRPLARGQLDVESLCVGRLPSRARPSRCTTASARASSTGWDSCSSIPPATPGSTSTRRDEARAGNDACHDRAPRGTDSLDPQAGPRSGPVASDSSGPGNYASSMLLPHLTVEKPSVEAPSRRHQQVAQRADAKRRFGFAEASTDAEAVLADDTLDAIFVVTRHHSHAELTCRALRAGKAVFVEKPLALSEERAASRSSRRSNETGNDRLMVGFNRRFSPMLVEMRSRFGCRCRWRRGPLLGQRRTARRARAGTATRSSKGPASPARADTSSTRSTGGSEPLPTEVFSMSSKDAHDLVVNLRFYDGSLGVDLVRHQWQSRYPEGDTRSLGVRPHARAWTTSGVRRSGPEAQAGRTRLGAVDKGQVLSSMAFLESVRNETAMPISVDSLVATTRATLAVAASQASGRPEPI